jgi:hypothetical protein
VKKSIKKQSMIMIFMIITIAVFITGSAIAKTQSITLSPESSVAFSNETVSVKVIYDVIDGDKTTGLGLRIHFNSKFIENITLADVYGEGMIGQHYSPQPDVKNLDGDASTDKYIVIAWASVTGNWPVFLSMPGALVALNVTFNKNAPNGETSLNVSPSAVAAGCKFQGKSAKILIQ